MDTLSAKAERNVSDIVRQAICHEDSRRAVVVFDLRSPLSKVLTEAYRAALPSAQFIDFDAMAPEDIVKEIFALQPRDLVVFVQSSNFLLAKYRIRIELFQREYAVIEHVHLERALNDRQVEIYVDALAYDRDYFQSRARMLKAKIDAAKKIVVRCDGGTELIYEGGMEDTKLNIGDYTGMRNIGGTFPIGEVFSEASDFTRVNGEAMIFSFAGIDHISRLYEPFKIRVENGVLVSHEGPPAFTEVLAQISATEQILVREFGVGLNRAMGKDRILDDITAFERQKGLHLSLGEKHAVYKKPGMPAKKTHYHIDIFVDVTAIEIDGEDVLPLL